MSKRSIATVRTLRAEAERLLEEEIDELAEAARLLGATQAKRLFGCYTAEDRRFELAMRESMAKHRTALRELLAHPTITHCDNCGCDWLDNGLNPIGCPYCKQSADDEVVFIDGVGAARSSIKSCHDGVQWIKVGDRVYWPLSDSDAKRLHSACCGNGSFDGPTTPLTEENKA